MFEHVSSVGMAAMLLALTRTMQDEDTVRRWQLKGSGL